MRARLIVPVPFSIRSHLRIVARAPQARRIRLNEVPWRLQYLNDDESELDRQDDKVRVRAAFRVEVAVLAITSETWDAIHSLDPDYKTPLWFDLLYDAEAMVSADPEPAIVLAATSMEVFANWVLNELAKVSAVPETLWKWINEREPHDRQPDLAEQFDVLLKMLCGHSLKENPVLWEKLMNLRTARNRFVHEGKAAVGGAPVTREAAASLLGNARDVVSAIRVWLPEAIRWPEFDFKTRIDTRMRMPGAAAPARPP